MYPGKSSLKMITIQAHRSTSGKFFVKAQFLSSKEKSSILL